MIELLQMEVHLKFHEGVCDSQPCHKIHHYKCAKCAVTFTADFNSRFTNMFGLILPTIFWPTCSVECYAEYYTSSDPNGVNEPASFTDY